MKIYFVLDSEHRVPALKIGSTVQDNVSSRISSIQTGNPSNLKLLGYIEGYAESYFHEKFKKHRIRGEWFKWEPIKRDIAKIALCYPEYELNFYRRYLMRYFYSSQYKTGKVNREIMLTVVKMYKDNEFLKKTLFKIMTSEPGKYYNTTTKQEELRIAISKSMYYSNTIQTPGKIFELGEKVSGALSQKSKGLYNLKWY